MPKGRLSGNKVGHLWVDHQMSVAEYRSRYSCARLNSFKVIGKNKRDVQLMMTRAAQKYVTAKALDQCRKDPAWEQHHNIDEFVVCRDCGAKLLTLFTHLRRRHHGWNVEEYHTKYPGAPCESAKDKEADRRWETSPRGRDSRNAASLRWNSTLPGSR